MKRLKGKTAIITGVGSEIGRASAMLLAREGAAVVAQVRLRLRLREESRQTPLPDQVSQV